MLRKNVLLKFKLTAIRSRALSRCVAASFRLSVWSSSLRLSSLSSDVAWEDSSSSLSGSGLALASGFGAVGAAAVVPVGAVCSVDASVSSSSSVVSASQESLTSSSFSVTWGAWVESSAGCSAEPEGSSVDGVFCNSFCLDGRTRVPGLTTFFSPTTGTSSPIILLNDYLRSIMFNEFPLPCALKISNWACWRACWARCFGVRYLPSALSFSFFSRSFCFFSSLFSRSACSFSNRILSSSWARRSASSASLLARSSSSFKKSITFLFNFIERDFYLNLL